ncbi:8-oxo-dGTP diphosphatase [Hathewaya proteolytica DSM 3090]|uniref:8-oxo-dGTP diphosphatase n=1 Tax=Hathewaya proteolytica DSM 3090 TaxID=1121331 RepID=A0A1M6M0T7_9CLOT|nr:8-oxo-dGTP diphosphatase [Hathewaya proteolytica DSM 3090]
MTNNFKGELKSSDEGQVYWVKMSELMDLKLAEGMDKMLQVFNNDDIAEYYFYKENDQWMEMLK